MPERKPVQSKGFSVDWLIRGSLTKIGDIFDRLTGRGWKPSSSLATSELIERMKALMDAEVRENGDKRRYVPHNIKLKMQWDKFSTDAEDSIRKLENEFLIAAVDHINDRHYFTHAPLSIEIKPDYFTSGVKLYVGFEKLEAEDGEAAIHVSVGDGSSETASDAALERQAATVHCRFQIGTNVTERTIELEEGKRISIGRTKENDLRIDDQSVSKAHASLLLNKEGRLVVADTGSTNGTLVNGERIAYGKAVEVSPGSELTIGVVKVALRMQRNAPAKTVDMAAAPTESFKVGEFEFSSRSERTGTSPQNVPTAPANTAVPAKQETVAPIVKPGEAPMPTPVKAPADVAEVAPQPALSEANIDLDKDKDDPEA